VGLAIRGLPVLVHEQSAAHFCPVQIEHWKEGNPIDTPVPLLTTFLSSHAPRPRVAGREVPRLQTCPRGRGARTDRDTGRAAG
jgi:hypothetical protein